MPPPNRFDSMKTLILSGFGTNCEKETLYACRRSGGEEVETRHINEIFEGAFQLGDYRFLILIGGFLDGDDLGGARACANRFRYRELAQGGTFLDELHRFIAEGRLVLGICNGFQLLVRLALLPGEEGNGGGQEVTFGPNAGGRFEDRWVHLHPDPGSPCIFTRGLTALELPVRHGEGRIIPREETVPARLVERRLAPLRYCLPEGIPTEAYPANPNGSPLGIAALCNPAGTVMGLMPHPEAFNHYTNHPQWSRRPKTGEDGDGLAIFRNAYLHLRQTAR
ncbi:MAG: phosphoribosylformylglycinamidine synthase subunit PurQ [SAR324 cluster bacterium]|nr:phosphoribosylformylglycinamidine synthase subunit PurQ [SAR324 cluster bacterium]